jgi:DNA-binding response OmpR family regulator
MTRIIIVEDEAELRADMALFLTSEGHDVRAAGDGTELNLLLDDYPDIAILDINLPGESGFDIARRLRARSPLGIIMLTARSQTDDLVTGLMAGADAYLAKPVSFRELAAHIASLSRRVVTGGSGDSVPPARSDPLSPDRTWSVEQGEWRLCTPAGGTVTLSVSEMRLLARLAAAPSQPVSRADLMAAVYDSPPDSESRALDALVRRLRSKVEKSTGHALPVQALYAVGYVFAGPLKVR